MVTETLNEVSAPINLKMLTRIRMKTIYIAKTKPKPTINCFTYIYVDLFWLAEQGMWGSNPDLLATISEIGQIISCLQVAIWLLKAT